MVHTAARAICLVRVYNFDLISLDFDLAGPEKGDAVADAIAASRNAHTPILVHSMNTLGTGRVVDCLPHAVCVPLSRLAKSNTVIKRVRKALQNGVPSNWHRVLSGVNGAE